MSWPNLNIENFLKKIPYEIIPSKKVNEYKKKQQEKYIG